MYFKLLMGKYLGKWQLAIGKGRQTVCVPILSVRMATRQQLFQQQYFFIHPWTV
jgi:hypothetical protein